MCKVSFKIDEILKYCSNGSGDWVRHQIQYSYKCYQYLNTFSVKKMDIVVTTPVLSLLYVKVGNVIIIWK